MYTSCTSCIYLHALEVSLPITLGIRPWAVNDTNQNPLLIELLFVLLTIHEYWIAKGVPVSVIIKPYLIPGLGILLQININKLLTYFQDCTTLRASWTPTLSTNVKWKVGSSWPSTCSRSSTICMGKISAFPIDSKITKFEMPSHAVRVFLKVNV